MKRAEVDKLVRALCEAQCNATDRILKSASYENLDDTVDGLDVRDVLRMWVWHFWSHHREVVRARGSLKGDNPHFHVPHFVRQANEEFGRFVGELACFDDAQLDLRPPDGDWSVREIAEHVLETLSGWIPDQVETACRSGENR